MQVRTLAVWRLSRSGSGAPWRQDRGSPAASQVQTVMERVMVLLRGGVLLSATTTGSRWSSRCCRSPPGRVRTEAVLSGDQGPVGAPSVRRCSGEAARRHTHPGCP